MSTNRKTLFCIQDGCAPLAALGIVCLTFIFLLAQAYADVAAPRLQATAVVGSDNLAQVQVLRELKPAHDYSGGLWIDSPSGVVWSSDGTKLAAYTGFGNLVTLWSVEGQVLGQLHRPGMMAPVDQTLAFVADDSQIVTPPASYREADIAFSVFDVATGSLVRKVPGPYPDKTQNYEASTIVASPDRSMLAVIYGLQLPQPVELYSTKSWTRLGSLAPPRDEFERNNAVAFSGDGKLIAVGRALGQMLVYDVASEKIVNRFDGGFPEGNRMDHA